jgi:hypothetical protein
MQLINKHLFSRTIDFWAFTSFIPLYAVYILIQILGIKLPDSPPAEFYLLGWVLVDGSHVYSTLYITYMDREVRSKLKWHLILVPALIFMTALILAGIGERKIFVHIIAYAAAIHFIRQEFGWMKIATRLDHLAPHWLSTIDKLTSYVMTITPVIWFLRQSQEGFWYQKGDLFRFPDWFSHWALAIFWPTVILFLLTNAYHSYKTKTFNLSKALIFLNTFFGWYVPKVLINHPYLSLWLVIFHHGLPYYIIVFKTERLSQKYSWLNTLGKFKYPLMYLVCAAIFYFFLKSHSNRAIHASFRSLGIWMSALLYAYAVTPQFTHFVLDGFIWKRKVGLVKA